LIQINAGELRRGGALPSYPVRLNRHFVTLARRSWGACRPQRWLAICGTVPLRDVL